MRGRTIYHFLTERVPIRRSDAAVRPGAVPSRNRLKGKKNRATAMVRLPESRHGLHERKALVSLIVSCIKSSLTCDYSMISHSNFIPVPSVPDLQYGNRRKAFLEVICFDATRTTRHARVPRTLQGVPFHELPLLRVLLRVNHFRTPLPAQGTPSAGRNGLSARARPSLFILAVKTRQGGENGVGA